MTSEQFNKIILEVADSIGAIAHERKTSTTAENYSDMCGAAQTLAILFKLKADFAEDAKRPA